RAAADRLLERPLPRRADARLGVPGAARHHRPEPAARPVRLADLVRPPALAVLRAEVERRDRLPVAHVETRAHQCRRRPGQILEAGRLREHLQAAGPGCRKTERAVLVENDELAVGVEELRARERAVLPQDSARADVDAREEGWSEVSAGSDDEVADPDRGADVNAHAV